MDTERLTPFVLFLLTKHIWYTERQTDILTKKVDKFIAICSTEESLSVLRRRHFFSREYSFIKKCSITKKSDFTEL